MDLSNLVDFVHGQMASWMGISRYPRVVNFPITDNCNSKCVMCNVWKEKVENELSPVQIRHILSRKEFSKVRHLGISGGEPTLREDLQECVLAIVESLKSLKTISITSHGFHSKKWAILLPRLKEICESKKVTLNINISVDGIGRNHEKIRRVKNGWQQVESTIGFVKENGLKLQLQSTISKGNLYSVNEIAWYAKRINVEVVFRMAVNIRRLYNEKIISSEALDFEERGFLADFFASDLLRSIKTSRGRRMYYRFMSDELQNPIVSRGNMPCVFQNEGVLIDSFGKLSPCSVTNLDFLEDAMTIDFISDQVTLIRKTLIDTTCNGCVHDQSGRWSIWQLIWSEVSHNSLIKKLLSATKLILDLVRIRFVNTSVKSEKILIIGAYGGEHVGDSAILGGVISRINNQYGQIKYDVLSTRVSRTSFWVKTLTFASQIKVISLKECLDVKYKAVVYAGGPIMEDLRLLWLSTLISKKIASGSDFVIEGCGWGPFKTAMGRTIANRMVKKASRITLRDNFPDFKYSHFVEQDPAFDYLMKVDKTIEGISPNRISELVDDIFTDDRKIVAINLRPIWNKFTARETIDSKFMTRLLDDIVNVIPMEHRIFYVPFNPDHCGFSDLDIVYDWQNNFISQRDVIIIKEEFATQDMIRLMKKVDYLIAMRFHACIFGSELGARVFGLDYDLTKSKGKVQGLFDQKRIDGCCSFVDPGLTEEIKKFFISE